MFNGSRIAVRFRRAAVLAGILISLPLSLRGAVQPDAFHFVILGDRTGEAQDGVYEQIWKQIAAEKPAFVVSVGDAIQGTNDATAEAEWRQFDRLMQPFRGYPFYMAPGNHDVWSAESERLFRQYAGRPLHYSFDYGQVHFIILDNSRSDQMPAPELAFLAADLEAHAGQQVKVIVSHRPSWLVDVALQNPNFQLHQLAKKYGVQYVVAGHVHQMLRLELDGVTYVSMASSGGHLRLSGAYEDGWFFGYGLVEVSGKSVDFQIKEIRAPLGNGRVNKLTDWGMAGLVNKAAKAAK